MSKLERPEADFFEILQARIDELHAEPFKHSEMIVEELQYLQTNFNSYMYKIRNKKQCD